jgi:hypothetical protein
MASQGDARKPGGPRSPKKAREFAWQFAAIALGRFPDDVDEDDDQEEGGP